MAKKYISKIKLPNIADVYDITVPADSELTVTSVTATSKIVTKQLTVNGVDILSNSVSYEEIN